MLRKYVLATAALMLFLSCVSVASADYSVGVKGGDWIEYNVSYTGTPTGGHDVTWARMDILAVSGNEISISIISRFEDGTTETTSSTLNLATGHLIDDFIIPADLTVGSSFPDENYGTVNITDAQTQPYAGANRMVLYASEGNNSYVWDQKTGVSVEGTTETDTYRIHTLVSATNMWQPAVSPAPRELDWTMWLVIVAVVVVIAFLMLALTAWYIQRKACQKRREQA
jgi:hypothetical protein